MNEPRFFYLRMWDRKNSKVIPKIIGTIATLPVDDEFLYYGVSLVSKKEKSISKDKGRTIALNRLLKFINKEFVPQKEGFKPNLITFNFLNLGNATEDETCVGTHLYDISEYKKVKTLGKAGIVPKYILLYYFTKWSNIFWSQQI